jgi:hypothetical protein
MYSIDDFFQGEGKKLSYKLPKPRISSLEDMLLCLYYGKITFL